MPVENNSTDSISHDDRYSRLYALEKMGVVKDYSSIRKKTIIIIGVGGIGSSASEMIVRCGIGKLIIFDYDKVEMANMNRLFFTPLHLGLPKVEACKDTLIEINSDVIIETHDCNITYSYELLLDRIKHGSLENDKVDLLLCCVDNYSARVSISQACNEADQCWMNSGVSENATTGNIQTCQPGYSACFQCAPPLIMSTGEDENSIKRDLVCTASLPTTMGIIAGLLIQNALKYILNFGNVSWFLGYDSMKNFFPTYPIAPNPDCNDHWCQLRQTNSTLGKILTSSMAEEALDELEETDKHINNEFGIEIINSDSEISFPGENGKDMSCSKQTNTITQSAIYEKSISLNEISEEFEKLMTR